MTPAVYQARLNYWAAEMRDFFEREKPPHAQLLISRFMQLVTSRPDATWFYGCRMLASELKGSFSSRPRLLNILLADMVDLLKPLTVLQLIDGERTHSLDITIRDDFLKNLGYTGGLATPPVIDTPLTVPDRPPTVAGRPRTAFLPALPLGRPSSSVYPPRSLIQETTRWEKFLSSLESFRSDLPSWLIPDLRLIGREFESFFTTAQLDPRGTKFLKKGSLLGLRHSIVLVWNAETQSVEIFLKPDVQISRMTPSTKPLVGEGAAKIVKLDGYHIVLAMPTLTPTEAEKIVYFTRPVSLGQGSVDSLLKEREIRRMLAKEFLHGGYRVVNFFDGIRTRNLFYARDAGKTLSIFLNEGNDATFTSSQHRAVITSFLQSVLNVLNLGFVPRDLKAKNSGINQESNGKVTIIIFDCYGDRVTFSPFLHTQWRAALFNMLEKNIDKFNDQDVYFARKQLAFEIIHWIGEYLRFFRNYIRERYGRVSFIKEDYLNHILTAIMQNTHFSKDDFAEIIIQTSTSLRGVPKLTGEPNTPPVFSQIFYLLQKVATVFEDLMLKRHKSK